MYLRMRTPYAATPPGFCYRATRGARPEGDKSNAQAILLKLTLFQSSFFHMASCIRALLVLVAVTAMLGRCEAICPPCACSGVGGVVQSVSCTHMSMDMYGIPDRIPSTTERL